MRLSWLLLAVVSFNTMSSMRSCTYLCVTVWALMFTRYVAAVHGQSYTRPPQLVSFTITPTTVDVSSGPATLNVRIMASDDLSGFGSGSTGSGSIDIRHTSGANPFGRGSLPLTGGTALNPTFEFTLTVPQFSLSGSYPINLTLIDNVFNAVTFTPANLQTRGFPSMITVATLPSLRLGTNSIAFAFQSGSNLPQPQSVTLSSSIVTSFTATASGGTWFSVSPTSGITPASLNVSVNPAGLNPGTYSGAITVAAPGASNSPQRLSIVFNVAPPSGPSIDSVLNGASFLPMISTKSWVSIFGRNLASNPAPGRTWKAEEIIGGALPTSLEGVSVRINNKLAAMAFVGPNQLNVQMPDDESLGAVSVDVVGPNGTGRSSVVLNSVAPALFTGSVLGGVRYAAAVHSNGIPVGRPEIIPGSLPARPGEIILLYGTGFGRTTPDQPTGRMIDQAPLVEKCVVRIGEIPLNPFYCGIVSPGLYQFNVQIPALSDGDHSVFIDLPGSTTQGGVFMSIKQ